LKNREIKNRNDIQIQKTDFKIFSTPIFMNGYYVKICVICNNCICCHGNVKLLFNLENCTRLNEIEAEIFNLFRLILLNQDIISATFNNIYLYIVWFYGVQRHFQQFFSYNVAVNFIGGGNRRKPPTYRKSQTIFIT